jgi:hypothetical protein
MKAKTLEHILSIIVVSAVLMGALYLINAEKRKSEKGEFAQIEQFVGLKHIEFNNPFHKALLNDVMNIYFPGQHDKNSETVKAIIQYKKNEFGERLHSSHVKEALTTGKFIQILSMYVKFFIVYIVVLLLTYYGVQTFGVLRFVRKKQKSPLFRYGKKRNIGHIILTVSKNILKGLGSFILFSPAYVIAYSIRTEFNTDTVFFMVLLGVISNGLLVMYTNKFYTFLVMESRKGYVDTAVVKNLNNSYNSNVKEGIPLKSIFRLVKRFDGHVFGHIFKNAQMQYFQTIKEQASFLITGLIIIEMALNIHGHLSYEMLKQILYKNYDIVLVIILGIFYTVKLTEVFTDFVTHRISLKYENK